MGIISGDNLNALSKCDLTKEIIGINKKNGDIVILSKENDLTVKEYFLSIFGAGKLANLEIDSRKVASLLSKYSWTNNLTQLERTQSKEALKQFSESTEYKGYQTVCRFANKVFLSKKDKTLLFSVSKEFKIENAFFTQIKRNERVSVQILPSVLWNPEMQFKHINEQLRYFRNSAVKIELNERDGEGCIDASDMVWGTKDFSQLTFYVITR